MGRPHPFGRRVAAVVGLLGRWGAGVVRGVWSELLAGRMVAVAGVVAAAGMLLVGLASPVWAHASFVTGSPEPGADLASAPAVVQLRFSEPLIVDLSQVVVTDPTGREFTSGPSGEREITVDLDATAQGTYTVDWKTVSPVDGHTLRGGFEFGVGSDVGEQAEPSDAPSASDLTIAVARTVEYGGLLGAIGLLSLAGLAGGGQLDWRPRGLHRWVALAAAGGFATVAGALLLASSGSLAATAQGFLLAPSGLPRAGRLVAELAAVGLTARAARRAGDGTVPGRPTRMTTALLVLAALGVLAASGHAAAAGQWGIIAGAGHLWTAGVWAGALLVMATQRPPGGWRGETGRRLLAEFSPVALACFAATVLFGSVRGTQELAHPADLWSSAYGQVLSAKLVLVAAMVPLSLLAWRRRQARPRTEGLLAAGAVVAAAVLAAFPVPPGRAGDQPAQQTGQQTQGLPQQGDLTLAATAGDTLLGLSVRPGESGINDLYVHLVPIDGPDQGGPLEATVQVGDADPAAMARCGTACRTATAPLDGGETLRFAISGADGGPATATVVLPDLPAPDGTRLARRLTARMKKLDSLRYEEVFGPVDPPLESTWEIVAPDRIHGTTTQRGGERFEIIRIGDRRWNRQGRNGPWQGGQPGGPTVQSNRFIWDYDDKTAARILGTDTLDGVRTRIVSFYVNVANTSIWYRLWVDDDAKVHKAQMRAQGHFMDRRYYDFNAPVDIRPP